MSALPPPPPGLPPAPTWIPAGAAGPPPRRRRRALRLTAAVLGGVLGVGATTVVVVGAVWYFDTGPQPAEALPASTIAYLSIDLDPAGRQLVEAQQVLGELDAMDDRDLASRDGIGEAVLELILDEIDCADAPAYDDFAAWAGDRFAIASVPQESGSDELADVIVVQVADAGAARDGLESLTRCASDGAAWHRDDGWAVIGATTDIVDRIVDQAAEESLADDKDYRRWVDEAGGPGIVTLYGSDEASDVIIDGLPTGSGVDDSDARGMLAGFEGGAAVLSFDDDAFQLTTAMDAGLPLIGPSSTGDAAGVAMEGLPSDTSIAYGIGLDAGWVEEMVDLMANASVDPDTVPDALAEAEDALGLEDLEQAIETALGESAVVALGPDFDLAAFDRAIEEGATSGPAPVAHRASYVASVEEEGEDEEPVEVALKVRGDPEAIEAILDDVRDSGVLTAWGHDLHRTDADSDHVVAGPDADYREAVLEPDEELGDDEAFENALPDIDDAGLAFYVDLDANWIRDGITDADPEFAEVVAEFEAFGLAGWVEDDVSYTVARLTVR